MKKIILGITILLLANCGGGGSNNLPISFRINSLEPVQEKYKPGQQILVLTNSDCDQCKIFINGTEMSVTAYMNVAVTSDENITEEQTAPAFIIPEFSCGEKGIKNGECYVRLIVKDSEGRESNEVEFAISTEINPDIVCPEGQNLVSGVCTQIITPPLPEDETCKTDDDCSTGYCFIEKTLVIGDVGSKKTGYYVNDSGVCAPLDKKYKNWKNRVGLIASLAALDEHCMEKPNSIFDKSGTESCTKMAPADKQNECKKIFADAKINVEKNPDACDAFENEKNEEEEKPKDEPKKEIILKPVTDIKNEATVQPIKEKSVVLVGATISVPYNPQAGNNGGDPSVLQCRKGEAISLVRVGSGAVIDSINFGCKKIEDIVSKSKKALPIWVSPIQIGGGGGGFSTDYPPEGHAYIGFNTKDCRGYSGISGFFVVCELEMVSKEVNSSGKIVGEEAISQTWGEGDGERPWNQHRCDPGTVMVGLKIRTGDYVDQMTPMCRKLGYQ